MKKLKSIIKAIVAPYIVTAILLYLGIRELGKLIYHYPRHSIVVVAVTLMFVIMTVTLLAGNEFQLLPSWMKIAMPYAIGSSAFVGSICWTIKSFGLAPPLK